MSSKNKNRNYSDLEKMEVLVYLGLLVFIIGGIGTLIAAFKTSILWGLGCLLIAPVSLLFYGVLLKTHSSCNCLVLASCFWVVMPNKWLKSFASLTGTG